MVRSDDELRENMESPRASPASFGDGSVFIEKYIERPHHIEFQILGDRHGNIIHLNERDCSIQRRHQKLIEIAPSLILTRELREEMGNAAIAIARAVNYDNAGTVEFLLDQEGKFYFIEMNPRLQVEHTVTEQITASISCEIRLRSPACRSASTRTSSPVTPSMPDQRRTRKQFPAMHGHGQPISLPVESVFASTVPSIRITIPRTMIRCWQIDGRGRTRKSRQPYASLSKSTCSVE